MTMILYGISNCDTVKKARRWLDEQGVSYRFHDVRKDGLDAARLQGWIDALGWEKLLNKAGTTFRKLPDAEKEGLNAAAAKALRQAIRRGQLRCRVDKQIDDLARMCNPIIQGWLNYYTRSYKAALYSTLQPLDRQWARWAMAKYTRLRRHRRRAEQ